MVNKAMRRELRKLMGGRVARKQATKLTVKNRRPKPRAVLNEMIHYATQQGVFKP